MSWQWSLSIYIYIYSLKIPESLSFLICPGCIERDHSGMKLYFFLKLYALPLRKKVADFYYSLLVFSYIPHFQKIQQNHNLSKSVTEVINTAWKVSIFGVFLVRIFPHSDWIRWDTLSKFSPNSVFSPNAGKYGPEKLQIRTLFTQWYLTFSLPLS